MDAEFERALDEGLSALGLDVAPEARTRLRRFAERLVAWNARVNLTSITDPGEVAEKHLVDSLALLPGLEGRGTLLDIGSGAGIPGMVLACARPDLDVVCCESIGKKVAFVKAISAELDLRVRAVAVRAEGFPDREGLARAEAVVSRALADPDRWVPLGARYVAPGGRLFAMLGRDADEPALAALGAANGLALEQLDRFVLPRSKGQRAIARFVAR